jgi:hypothetical protein
LAVTNWLIVHKLSGELHRGKSSGDSLQPGRTAQSRPVRTDFSKIDVDRDIATINDQGKRRLGFGSSNHNGRKPAPNTTVTLVEKGGSGMEKEFRAGKV